MSTPNNPIAVQADAINDLHPQLTAMVNNFLREKNIPLQLHSLRLAEASPRDVHCCVIDGMVHCGPECP